MVIALFRLNDVLKSGDTVLVYKIYKASKSIYENKAIFTYYKMAEGIKKHTKKSINRNR